MSFYRRIQYFLVHTLFLSNKEAQQLIANGSVQVDGNTISENCLISDLSEIKVNGKTERTKKELVYLIFYKPVGFESTLSPDVEDNLLPFFKDFEGLAIAGRLDKQSEGLLLLSNDGKWVEKICNPKFEKEKEYLVTLDGEPDNTFIEAFKSGVKIGHYLTKPCECEIISGSEIKIILTEGKNRQIRRMCKALVYSVLTLKRIRVADFHLGNLSAGEFKVTKI